MSATYPLSREKHQAILDAMRRNPRPTFEQVARELGVHGTTVMRYAKKPLPGVSDSGVDGDATDTDERNGDERMVKRVVNKRIRTLAELAKACDIDTSEWEIYKWRCVAWQTGMKNPDTKQPFYSQQFSVSAWMRLKRDVVAAKNEIEALRKAALNYAPKYKPFIIKPRPKATGNMLEISIVDHHIGALIWGKETGDADWDVGIAERCWNDALEHLIERTAHFRPDSVLLVVGNDQLNSDNRAGTTERGTGQRNDSRYQKMFSTSKMVTIRGVERLKTVAPKVIVLPVGGNHDPLSTWHLGDTLESWFHRDGAVEVRNEPTSRKYVQHGVNMLMFAHGNAKKKLEDYGRVMAAEKREMWGATKWHEAHTADKHQRRLVEFEDYAVRILPSLRPPCDWSSEEMLIGSVRAAEAYVWNLHEGLVGTGCYSILRGDRAA